ncbi:uncharacterized protein LOC142339833 isoform X2 [Convolutriloba macropyga]|uniref:uncharacterized protein LOC142339833 isoform X2 n=1 Tax=Convolutriloba macropyga TaxID=536237 RepID=UPI003F5263EC
MMGSFIEIVYGNNERMFCNADCASINLLQFIRDKCNVGYHDLDLADTNGVIKSLRKSFNGRASLQLESGCTYIPVMFIPSALPGSASTAGMKITTVLYHQSVAGKQERTL